MNYLAIILLMAGKLALAQNFGPNKKEDFEENYNCHSDRCVSYQFIDLRNPPTVKAANSFITSVLYPMELQRCDWGADKVYSITAIFPDGSTQQLEPTKKAKLAFRKMKITVKPDLAANGEEKSGPRTDLYKLPRTNLQCDDTRGTTYDVMLVTDIYPHLQVTLGFKSRRLDKSNILKFVTQKKRQEPETRALKPAGGDWASKPVKVQYIKRFEGNLSRDQMVEFVKGAGQ